jgi:hypothetical protein
VPEGATAIAVLIFAGMVVAMMLSEERSTRIADSIFAVMGLPAKVVSQLVEAPI